MQSKQAGVMSHSAVINGRRHRLQSVTILKNTSHSQFKRTEILGDRLVWKAMLQILTAMKQPAYSHMVLEPQI